MEMNNVFVVYKLSRREFEVFKRKELDDNHFEFSNCRPGERIAPETSPEDLQDSGNVFWFPGQSGDYQ